MDKIVLANGIWKLTLSEDGHLLSLSNGKQELVRSNSGQPICEFLFEKTGEKKTVTAANLLRHDEASAAFHSSAKSESPIHLRYDWELKNPDEEGTALLCSVYPSSTSVLDTDVLHRWNWPLQLPFSQRKSFTPLFDGKGLRTVLSKEKRWHYECAGDWGIEETERLALPLLDEYSPETTLHITHFADPYFSTGIVPPTAETHGVFASKFLHDVGPQQFQGRTFGLYLHHGDADTALRAYFNYAFPHCSPGPDWIHEIAMVDYDYLSKKGEGWYRDIDKLADLIPSHERHRVVMTLHGWYDFLGRYCYDIASKNLLEKWTAMPGGDKIPMSLADMHKRIAYAKDRGFRIILYFADGTAIDSGAPTYSEEIVFREPDGGLRKHHWSGPDTLAQTYIMNPVHPRVQDFFRGYLAALLREFGQEIDGLNWDETFTTKIGDLSTGKHPGYCERVFMLFCKELREMVKAHNPRIVFLSSDCTGLALPQEDGTFWRANPAQNALVFDGTFQDSHFSPTAWQYGLFPNYRNVLWSCNWAPHKNFDWNNTGVRIFGVPVPITNGWVDDKGISECTEDEIRKFMQLFEFRKALRYRLRWLEATDEV